MGKVVKVRYLAVQSELSLFRRGIKVTTADSFTIKIKIYFNLLWIKLVYTLLCVWSILYIPGSHNNDVEDCVEESIIYACNLIH
jgi:hypothetical protein